MVAEIREFGKAAGYDSLNKIEKAADIPLNSIYKWDTNSPSVDRVLKVAKCLGVSIDAIVGYKIEKSDSIELPDELRYAIDRLRSASPQKLKEALRYLRFLESDLPNQDA